MRQLRIRPYVVFPGPDTRTLAIYIQYAGAPAFLLVHQCWAWLREEGEAQQLAEDLARLRQEAEALSRRLNCPVAGILQLFGWYRRKPALFSSTANQYDLSLAHLDFPLRATDLRWIRPALPASTVPLPPFPRPTWLPDPFDARWWQAQLTSWDTLNDAERKKRAKGLCLQALHLLQEAPARLLVEGSALLIPVHQTLSLLLDLLNPLSGQRYLLWTGLYLAAACMADPEWSTRSESVVLNFLNTLLERQTSWSARQRRVLLRGLQLLVEKSWEHNLSPESAIGSFFRTLFTDLFDMRDPPEDWKWKMHLKDLCRTLASKGYLPLGLWDKKRKHYLIREEMVVNAYRGLLENFQEQPELSAWRLLRGVAFDPPFSQVLYHHLRWTFYENTFSDAFWELAAQEVSLAERVVKVALEQQSDPHLPLAPQARERLTALIRQWLASPNFPSHLRQSFEDALTRLSTT